MARKGTIKNMGKVQREMGDARKARAAAKAAPDAKASSTERLRKAALAEINGRLVGGADGKQDHEVPSEKEVANNANVGAAPKAKKERAPKAPKAPKPDRSPSALNLAAAYLASCENPKNIKEITEAVLAAGWKTEGKTPGATLNAAIIREIKAKGKESRFAKADRGMFTKGAA